MGMTGTSDHLPPKVERAASFENLLTDGTHLYWTESRPDGRSAVVRWSPSSLAEDVAVGVGSGVHAYGGGAVAPSPVGTWWVSDVDGQIRLDDVRITAATAQHGDLRFMDGLLLAVREGDAGDEFIAIDGTRRTARALRCAPFIASPTLHNGLLAWVEWPADAMPWDHAEVWTAPLDDPDGARLVAGGRSEAATQPAWGPNGDLYFMSDRSGWWNLYRYSAHGAEAIAPVEAECTDALWELGYRSTAFLPDDRIVMIAHRGPDQHLVLVEPGGQVRTLPSPYTSFKPFLAEFDGRVAVIAASATQHQQVVLIDPDGNMAPQVVRGDPTPVPDSSSPEVVTADSSHGPVTVLLYRPLRPHASGKRPLIVRAHPGPTHHSEPRLEDDVQYFTSQGFAVADVDYRGSTGYGRDFRTVLNGRWGILDVDDCFVAAEALVKADVADPEAVFISGSSAGGYTALRAVSRSDTPFVLAVARSAIVDPGTWTHTAPRFQRAHAATLSHGSASVDSTAVCRPVLLIHGLADHVAPAEDTQVLAATLEERGVLAGYLAVPGAGHYLSGADVERVTLEAELDAYEAVLKPPRQALRT